MNIKEFLNSPGITIKNPNKKSKKDKQPDTITLPFTRSNTESIYSQANEEFDDVGNMLTNIEDPFKYDNHGITLTRKGTELKPGTEFRNLDFELADAQSNWTKAGNALAQTVVGEIVLGSLKGATDLALGAPQALAVLGDTLLQKVFGVKDDRIQNALGMQDADFSNPISAKLQEWQDKFNNEVAPIYTTPGVDISNGGLGNFGWWMSNMPSIMSSITLLLPARGVTMAAGKIASMIGKANTARRAAKIIKGAEAAKDLETAAKVGSVERVAKNLNAYQRLVNDPIKRARLARAGSDFADASLMRTIENYQEAHQTYQDMYSTAATKLGEMSDEEYNQFVSNNEEDLKANNVDVSDKNAVAKHIAKKAADRTFVADFSNIVFDFWQLHALGDIGKLAKNVKSPKLSRLHRESKLAFAKSAEEGATGLGKSKLKRAGEWIYDVGTGAARKTFSELTEGVEEGVNYIASQEGITYGNTLLGLETDTTKNSFWNDRLRDYFVDSAFWESAFWGVMGGVVFGQLGTAFNRARIASARKADEKRRAENKTTGESVNLNPDNKPLSNWIELSEMPEIKAAREAINRREYRLRDLQSKLNLIDNHKNPERALPNGEYLEFGEGNRDVQEDLARMNAIQQFRSELAFDAINSGTYDSLVDYLRDDNIQQALVNLGIAKKEDVKSFVEETISDMEATKQAYYNELAHVNSQVAAINADKPAEGKIGLEYVQHIARTNADRRMAIRALDKKIQKLEVQEQEQLNGDNAPSGVAFDTKRTVRLSMLINEYGKLEADKKAVKEDSELREWAKAKNVQEIENQQDGILKAILDTANTPYRTTGIDVTDENGTTTVNSDKEKALGAALLAIQASKLYKKIGDNYVSDYSAQEAAQTDEEIVKTFGHIFGESTSSTATLSQIAKVVEQDLGSLVDPNNRDSIINTNKKLYDIYTNLADLEIQRSVCSSFIASSQIQIKERVDYYHNQLSSVRNEVIKKAEKAIRDIHTKYMGTNMRDVEMAVIAAYRNDKAEAARIARENLTGTDEEGHSDAEKLISALSILNFGAASNELAFRYIAETLAMNAEKRQTNGENTSVFFNPQQAPQRQQTSNPSNELFGDASEQASGENSNLSQSTEPVAAESLDKDSRTKRTFNVTVDNGVLSARMNSNAEHPVIGLGNSATEYELAISALPKEQQVQYILSDAFDNVNADVLLDDIELTVTSNPIIAYNGKQNKMEVVSKGTVTAINKNTGELVDLNTGNIEDSLFPTEEAPQVEETETEEPIDNDESAVNFKEIEQQAIARSKDTASSSSTGEVTASSDNTPLTRAEVVQRAGKALNDAIISTNQSFDNITDWEAIRTAMTQALNPIITNGQFDADELNAVINKQIVVRQRMLTTMEDKDDLDKAADNLYYASRYEEADDTDFSAYFKESARRFIELYLQNAVVPAVDGKPSIRLRDILDICNQAHGGIGIEVAANMYDVVKSYLLSDEGKQLYNLIDEVDVTTDNVLNKVNKTNEELREEDQTVVGDYRLNIQSLITQAEKSGRSAEHFKALNSLKKGDTLIIHRDGKGLNFEANGQIIGSMPFPKLDKDTNGYYKVNDGWVHNVSLDANGQVVSTLYDDWEYIFTSSDKDADALRGLFIDYMRTKDPVARASIINVFSQNPLIAALVSSSKRENTYSKRRIYIEDSGEPNYERLFNGILDVWNYTYMNSKANKNKAKQLQEIRDNLQAWFNKLYDTYNTVSQIDENYTAEVVYAPDGETNIVVTDGNTASDENYKKLKLVQEGIADKSRARIAVIANGTAKISNPSGLGNGVAQSSISGWRTFDSLIALYGNEDTPRFVKAIGVRVSDAEARQVGSKADKIFRAIGSAMHSYLTPFDNEQASSPMDRLELQMFFTDLFQGEISLLRATNGGIKVRKVEYPNNPNVEGVEISYLPKGANPSAAIRLQIITKDFRGRNCLGYRVVGYGKGNYNASSREIMDVVAKFMLAYTSFGFESRGIELDNGARVPRGIIRSKTDTNNRLTDGMVLEIKAKGAKEPILREEYDSYNDFLVQNNLFRVNTEVKETKGVKSNFAERTDNQRKNRIVVARLKKPATSPVEGNIDNSQTSPISQNADAETFERVKNIIETNKTNPVREILSVIRDDNAYEQLEQIISELNKDGANISIDDIFPKSIVYDPEYNSGTGEKDTDGFIAQTSTQSTESSDKYYSKYGRRNAENKPTTARIAKNDTVVVGNKLLNMLSSIGVKDSKNKRNRAIRKLIHERIHQLANDPTKNQNKDSVFQALKEIYILYHNALNTAIQNTTDSDTKDKLIKLKSVLQNYVKSGPLKDATELNDRLMEEFLAEAITNKAMYTFLQNVEYAPGSNKILDKYDGSNKKTSLFNKIIDLIARFFGWNKPNDGKLYAKLYDVLRDLGDSNNTVVEPSEEIKQEEEKKGDETGSEEPVKPQSNEGATSDDWSSDAYDDSGDNFDDENQFSNPLDLDMSDFDSSNDDSGTDWIDTIDYGAPKSRIEGEPDLTDTELRVLSPDTIMRALPIEEHNNFKKLQESGYIEMKCVK